MEPIQPIQLKKNYFSLLEILQILMAVIVLIRFIDSESCVVKNYIAIKTIPAILSSVATEDISSMFFNAAACSFIVKFGYLSLSTYTFKDQVETEQFLLVGVFSISLAWGQSKPVVHFISKIAIHSIIMILRLISTLPNMGTTYKLEIAPSHFSAFIHSLLYLIVYFIIIDFGCSY